MSDELSTIEGTGTTSDELSAMDATAQAELVRSRRRARRSWSTLRSSGSRRVDGELNAIIHPLFDEAREAAAADVPDGPFRGVPFVLKDLGAAFAGQPLHLGMRVLKDADFRAPHDTYLAQRFRAAGFDHVGKTNTPELGILPTTEPVAYGATRNPWDTDAHAGRIERRLRRRGGGGHRADRARQRRRRLDPDPGQLLRAVRPQADPRADLARARSSATSSPGSPASWSSPARSATPPRSSTPSHGPGARRSLRRPPPLRPYVDEVGAEPRRAAHRLLDRTRRSGRGRRRLRRRGRARRELLESLGHTSTGSRSPTRSASRRAGAGVDFEDSFLTRWAAGQAATLDQTRRCCSAARSTADDVEPLTWALAEIGRSATSGRYLRDVDLHQRGSAG